MKNLLLWILNKFYNGTPCEYGLINNVEAYDRAFLDDEAKRNPKKPLSQFLKEMDRMDKCMASGENCVILGGTTYKGADILLEELSKDLANKS